MARLSRPLLIGLLFLLAAPLSYVVSELALHFSPRIFTTTHQISLRNSGISEATLEKMFGALRRVAEYKNEGVVKWQLQMSLRPIPGSSDNYALAVTSKNPQFSQEMAETMSSGLVNMFEEAIEAEDPSLHSLLRVEVVEKSRPMVSYPAASTITLCGLIGATSLGLIGLGLILVAVRRRNGIPQKPHEPPLLPKERFDY